MKKAFEEARVNIIRLNQDVIVTSTAAGEGNENGSTELDGQG